MSKKAKPQGTITSDATLDPDRRFRWVAGLDLSLNFTGVVVLDLTTGDTRSTRIQPGARRGVERLIYNASSVLEFIASARKDIRPHNTQGFAMIEGYAFGAAHQLPALGENGGVVKVALHKAGIPFAMVAPGTLKKFVTGNGAAKKDEVIASIHAQWKVLAENSDEADALALAMFGACLQCADFDFTKAQIASANGYIGKLKN